MLGEAGVESAVQGGGRSRRKLPCRPRIAQKAVSDRFAAIYIHTAGFWSTGNRLEIFSNQKNFK